MASTSETRSALRRIGIGAVRLGVCWLGLWCADRSWSDERVPPGYYSPVSYEGVHYLPPEPPPPRQFFHLAEVSPFREIDLWVHPGKATLLLP